MLGKVSFLPEALATHGAHEWLFAGVGAYVNVYRVLVFEAFTAYVTVVQRPFFFSGWVPGRLVVTRHRSRSSTATGTSDRRSGTAAGRLFRLAVSVV